MRRKIKNAWICRQSGNKIVPQFGDLIIQKGKIGGIQKKSFRDFLKNGPEGKSRDDAGGRIITLPNINFHEHIYSRLAKGLPITGDTGNFYNILDNIWWKLDRSLNHGMTEASAYLAAIESIKNGVTCIFDHHASPKNTNGSLKVIADTLKRFKLRGVMAFETSDRNGDKLKSEGLIENKTFFQTGTDSEIKSMFGLHASFTIDEKTLEDTGQFLGENDIGIHIHLCEDKSDRKLSIEKHGLSPIERLLKHNLLNEKSILAHGIHLTKKEMLKIDKSGAAIAFNPDSNLNNSVGINPFSAYPENLTLLPGTDGMHANPAKSIKNAFLLMRHQGISSAAAFAKIEQIYFYQIEFVKKYFPKYPQLVKGDAADFIVWDYIPPTPLNKQNFWGHYIYGVLESQVYSTVRNGNYLMQDKKLVGVDEENILRKVRIEGEKLFKKFKKL